MTGTDAIEPALVGTWRLVATTEHAAQAGLIGEESDPDDIDGWLNAAGAGSGEEVAAEGLVLTIEVDARFRERREGSPGISWFDAEGVLADDVEPFDGIIAAGANAAYLRPEDIASLAVPKEGAHGPAELRYDDGDTKIVDALVLEGERLVRTINVVTDELYLNRVVLVYARDGA